MKVIENEGSKTYVIEGPTDKATVVLEVITDSMESAGVEPEEVMPVLGEAVIRFLYCVAEVAGYEPMEIVKAFGEGSATAELEYEKATEGDGDGNT